MGNILELKRDSHISEEISRKKVDGKIDNNSSIYHSPENNNYLIQIHEITL